MRYFYFFCLIFIFFDSNLLFTKSDVSSTLNIKNNNLPFIKNQLEVIRSYDRDVLVNISFDSYKMIVYYLNSDIIRNSNKGLFSDNQSFDDSLAEFNTLLTGLKNVDPRLRLVFSRILLRKFNTFIKVISDYRDLNNYYDNFVGAYKPRYYFRFLEKFRVYLYEILQNETTVGQKYLSLGIDNKKFVGFTYKSIKDLYLYLVRNLLLYQLKNSFIQPKDFKTITSDYYRSITSIIDKEDESDIPIYNLKNNIEILIYSLDNHDSYIKKSAINFLSQIYNSNESLRNIIVNFAKKNKNLAYKLNLT